MLREADSLWREHVETARAAGQRAVGTWAPEGQAARGPPKPGLEENAAGEDPLGLVQFVVTKPPRHVPTELMCPAGRWLPPPVLLATLALALCCI